MSLRRQSVVGDQTNRALRGMEMIIPLIVMTIILGSVFAAWRNWLGTVRAGIGPHI
jgi:hypothetical protein